MDPSIYEKLGAFYLGRPWTAEDGASAEVPLLYDAKDLTTHALVVGMTGSGKTGLSVGLLEEAAIDGVPSLVIDPKGDMGNLMLTFPELRPDDFLPWVDRGAASRAGKTVEEHAAGTAALWRNGLADWGQQPDRIRRFREAVDVSIYTPGSSAGLQLSVLRSFAAPPASLLEDGDALREQIQSAVSGLLALLGMSVDPVTSREHVLLSNILDRSWRDGRDLDLAGLIGEIQKPPFEKLGVIDLETFYPAGDRMALAMRLNNLLASPGFSTWLEGEPLDAGRLLYTPEGRPRISIVSLAHLSDPERMFVVTLLLGEVVSWMRSQPGTSSLRALLYMDEIFGFFPPSAAPPSKQPMLTLLKQARAFGLGVVLATQNPVDLDYKGLSNCGTWFIGRLQTERDKARVLDGLESAAVGAGTEGFDRAELSDLIGSLGKRVFLMNNVHEDGPALFQTRWVLSYLRGPLVRTEIERLMGDRRGSQSDAQDQEAAAVAPPAGAPAADEQVTSRAPSLAEGLDARYRTVAKDSDSDGGESRRLLRPRLAAHAQLHFKNATAGVDAWQDVTVLCDVDADATSIDWQEVEWSEGDVHSGARRPAGFSFASVPPVLTRDRSVTAAEKRLKTVLYQQRSLTFYGHKATRLKSKLGESEGEFRQRVQIALAEKRDLEVEKLRAKYAKRLESLENKIRTAAERVDREESQLRDRKLQTAVTFGTSLLGAVFGRRSRKSTAAARVIRDLGRSRREGDDVDRAEEKLEVLEQDHRQLQREAEEAIEELGDRLAPAGDLELTERIVRPMKSDISIDRFYVLWHPWQIDRDGIAKPLF